MCDAIAECGKRHTALSGRCRSGDLPAFPAPAHRAKVLRERLGGATKPDAPCFGCRNSFRLPLADGFPLRLRHVAKKLQHQIGDQRPGEIPIFSGIQQGHIQHDNGRADEYTVATWLRSWYNIYAKPNVRIVTADRYQLMVEKTISMQQTPAGFTLRTYTHATRQKQDEAAQTMGSFMAQIR